MLSGANGFSGPVPEARPDALVGFADPVLYVEAPVAASPVVTAPRATQTNATAPRAPPLRGDRVNTVTPGKPSKGKRRPCVKCGSLEEFVQQVPSSSLRIDDFLLSQDFTEQDLEEAFHQELDPQLDDWDQLLRFHAQPSGLRGNLRCAKANRKDLKTKRRVESQQASARISLTFVHDSLELIGPIIAITNRQLGTALRVSVTWTLLEPVHLALIRGKRRAYSAWELEPTRTTRAGKTYQLRLPETVARRLRLAKSLKPASPSTDAHLPSAQTAEATPDPLLAPCACAAISQKFRSHPSGHVWTYDRKFVFELGELFGLSLDFTGRLYKLLAFGLGHRERQRFCRAAVKEQLDNFVQQTCKTFGAVVQIVEIQRMLERLCNEVLTFAERDDVTPTPVTASEEFADFMNRTSHLWGIRRCDKATNNPAFVCEWLLEHLTTRDLESQPLTFEKTPLRPDEAASLITQRVHGLGWWFSRNEVDDRIAAAGFDGTGRRQPASLFDRFPDVPIPGPSAKRKYPGLLDKGALRLDEPSAPPLRRSLGLGFEDLLAAPVSLVEPPAGGSNPHREPRNLVGECAGGSGLSDTLRLLETAKHQDGPPIVLSSPESSVAYMTQLVKAHKKPPTLRFLTTSQFCATTRLSKWLQGGLKAIRNERVRLCDHLYHLTGASFNFTIDESADVLLLAPQRVTSINVDDFTRLYTTLPIHHPTEGLVAAIKFWAELTFRSAKRRLGPRAALVASLDGAAWEWRPFPSSNPLEINVTPDLIALCFCTEASNNYFISAGKVWLQINGIPMGSSTSVDACDLLLGMHEFMAQWELVSSGIPRLLTLAIERNPNFRFVDDHLSFNNTGYLIDMVRIFNLGKFLGIEDQTTYANDSATSLAPAPADLTSGATATTNPAAPRPRGLPGVGGNFMDLTLSIDGETGRLVTRFYKKNLPFEVIKFQHGETNAPALMVHGIIIAQVSRLVRLTTDPADFTSNVGALLNCMTHIKRLDYFVLLRNISRTIDAERAPERFNLSKNELVAAIELAANVSRPVRRLSTAAANKRQPSARFISSFYRAPRATVLADRKRNVPDP